MKIIKLHVIIQLYFYKTIEMVFVFHGYNYAVFITIKRKLRNCEWSVHDNDIMSRNGDKKDS